MAKKKKRLGGGAGALFWLGAGFSAAWLRRRHKRRLAESAEHPASAPSPSSASATLEKPARQSELRIATLASEADAEQSAATATEAWVPGPTGSLRILESGPEDGQPVVFVHGLGAVADDWLEVMSRLPAHRCLAFDLPGHGGSEGLAPLTIEDLSSSIGALLDDLAIRRALIVAHSLGATAAIDYAGRAAGRVSGLLLVDANGDQSQIPQQDRQTLLDALASDAHGELEWHFRQILVDAAPEIADSVLQRLRETPAGVLESCLQAALEHSPMAALDSYGGSVRSVISDLNDLPYSLHRLRPELQSHVIYGAGHWLMLERPQEVAELVADFPLSK